ncbi:MAG: hypothetical protein RLZZ312_625 [Bacteroidota bacterium]|jgi:small conductance mechanosensitive channel
MFIKNIVDTTKVISYSEKAIAILIDYAPKLVSAFMILFIGLYLIKLLNKLVKRIMVQRELELTLSKFLADLLNWTLKILLFVMFISKLGIETSSFVAILGAAGLAVGLSLQGSLSNFAGGVLIILFKPFRVGDLIEAQNTGGTVQEIQIFVTKILTANNSIVSVPNGLLSNGVITNHTVSGLRRIDIQFGVSYGTDIVQVRNIVLQILDKNDLVLKEPLVSIDVVLITDSAIKMAIRSWVLQENYGLVSGYILEHTLLKLKEQGVDIQPTAK